MLKIVGILIIQSDLEKKNTKSVSCGMSFLHSVDGADVAYDPV